MGLQQLTRQSTLLAGLVVAGEFGQLLLGGVELHHLVQALACVGILHGLAFFLLIIYWGSGCVFWSVLCCDAVCRVLSHKSE